MRNIKIFTEIIALILIACNVFVMHAQDQQYQICTTALKIGAYDYSKVKKKSYKVYYDQEAEEKFGKLLISDERLRSTTAFGVYVEEEDGSKEFFREEVACEYCPELDYVILTGGHGYISTYDLTTMEEVLTNPSTHIYSQDEEYRFGIHRYDGISYYIEKKEGGVYASYLLDRAQDEGSIAGVYWADEETMHYLREKKYADGTKYWIAYCARLSRVGSR